MEAPRNSPRATTGEAHRETRTANGRSLARLLLLVAAIAGIAVTVFGAAIVATFEVWTSGLPR